MLKKTKQQQPKKKTAPKMDADDKKSFAKDFNKNASLFIKKIIAKNPSGKAT